MRKSRIAAVGALPVALALGIWAFTGGSANAESAYRFATVERGSLQAGVSATGTVGAVTTVQVGTQVSGQVTAIYVDFNDRVREGQLLARIDPTLAQQTVREAEASLARSRAELEQTEREYERNRQLHDRQVVTDSELETIEYQLEIARANVRSAQVSVERANRNLDYTEIHAPIDGVVVERNVDVGQTVAASLSAPQLFLIAQDLSEMQILAAVDESDIGQIHEGQTVEFTVQAYPDDRFTGTVKQVRLQSTTQENVVSYTAVVSVTNDSGRLLPGMTATVDFVTGSAEDVFLIPNAALRFRPTEAMLEAARAEAGAEGGNRRAIQAGSRTGASAATGATASAGDGDAAVRRAAAQTGLAVLWYLDDDGQPARVRIRAGLSDGQRTVVEGAGLTEGMQVIVALTTSSAGDATAASPFGGGQTQPSGPRLPGGI